MDGCKDGRENRIPFTKFAGGGGGGGGMIIFFEQHSFMHMLIVPTLYRQSIKLLHQKLW